MRHILAKNILTLVKIYDRMSVESLENSLYFT